MYLDVCLVDYPKFIFLISVFNVLTVMEYENFVSVSSKIFESRTIMFL